MICNIMIKIKFLLGHTNSIDVTTTKLHYANCFPVCTVITEDPYKLQFPYNTFKFINLNNLMLRMNCCNNFLKGLPNTSRPNTFSAAFQQISQ